MITIVQILKNPELVSKHKEDLKDERMFDSPWCLIFWRYPYLYREFSDRLDELGGWAIANALERDPTMVLDLKNYLHKTDKAHVSRILKPHPELSLCIKYKDNPDMVEAAYYIEYPHALDNLNKEERREMSKRIIELLKEIPQNIAKKGKGHGKR